MPKLKAHLKNIFYTTGISPLLDKLAYLSAKIKHHKKNRSFKNNHPEIQIPPDYYLYETFQLDYEQYLKDGENTARDIISWVTKHMPDAPAAILEWGCGVGRIVRHLPKFTKPKTHLFACDISTEMINWDSRNINNVQFTKINYTPPTSYNNETFDLIYGISVFTHIEFTDHKKWIEEIFRILKKDGVFLFTTHGQWYANQLLTHELETLREKGAYTRQYAEKGHRLMTTYNEAKTFSNWLSTHFDIVEYHDGKSNVDKVGGQDLWIVKKRSN